MRSRVPCAMTRSNSSGRPLIIATRWTTHSTPSAAERRLGGVRDVALDELAAPGLERLRPAAVADERSDGVVAGSQRMHDLRADEPVAAGDEDLHFSSPSKLRQYALGVGPFWPWYFEPRPAEP